MPRTLMVALLLGGKKCLVLGGGEEAARRARALHQAGAQVVVVGDAPGPALEALASAGSIALERRPFASFDLEGCWLVVLADPSPELGARLGPLCAARQLWFCAVDQPEHNGFHHVAIARDGAVSIGVSTDGAVPALGARLRQELERCMRESSLGQFAERLARLRERTPAAARRSVLGALISGVKLSGSLELPRLDEDEPGRG